MFTGIIEEKGIVKSLRLRRNLALLEVISNKVGKSVKTGESISVNGVCLTVTGVHHKILSFDMMKETLGRTNLKDLKPEDGVNLEPALKFGSRMGGHFVTGHIDGVGVIKKRITSANYVELMIALSEKFMRYVVPRGSICIDGISLTVGKNLKDSFSVYLIPHTLKVTTIGRKKAGDTVNIETDLLAKYVFNVRNKK